MWKIISTILREGCPSGSSVIAREEVAAVLRGASNSELVAVTYLDFEFECFSKDGLGLVGLGLGFGMSTMSLMFWRVFLQLALE